MKLVKLLFISFFAVGLEAVSIDKQYIDELIHYKLSLNKEIKNPFIVKVNKPKIVKKSLTPKKVKKKKEVKKAPIFIEKKLVLMAILNNKVLVQIEGANISKWVKVGGKIDDYKIEKIINNNAILVSSKKKRKIVMLNKKNINIKVRK